MSEFKTNTRVVLIGDRYYRLKQLPINKLEDLTFYLNIILNATTSLRIEDLYSYESQWIDPVLGAIKDCLGLYGFNVEDLTPKVIAEIVEEIKAVNGIGVSEKKPEDDSVGIETSEYIARTKALLIHTELCKGLLEVEQICNTLPADEVNNLISARADQLKTPEQREKEEQEMVKDQLKKSFQSSGGFFDDMPRTLPK